MSYSGDIYNPAGQKYTSISTVVGCEFARSFSNVGELTLTFSDIEIDPSVPQRNWRIVLYRYIDNYAPSLVGRTVWFIRSVDWDVIEQTITIRAQDSMVILSDRIVAYTPQTPYADKTFEELGLVPFADDSILAYLRENYGSLALDTDRDLSSFFIIPADKSLGAQVEKQAAWQDLLSTIQDLCKASTQGGVPIYFDVIFDEHSNLLFALWIGRRGTDRTSGSTQPHIFSVEKNNLSKLVFTWDYSKEKNVAYVGGYDSGASRVIETVIDSTRLGLDPFARAEVFVDGGDNDVSSVLQDIGRIALDGMRPLLVVNAEAVETPESVYGVDYEYADTVSVVSNGLEIACDISAISGRYADGEDVINVRLTGQRQL